jgi:hypothetical protein
MWRHFPLPAVSLLALCGCATNAAPYGLFDGQNTQAVDSDYSDVHVLSVDGSLPADGPLGTVSLTPGVHLLRLSTTRSVTAGSSQGVAGSYRMLPSTNHGSVQDQQVLIKVEACKRYSFVARRDTHLPDRPWELVARGESAIPGCKVPPPATPAAGPAKAS